MNWWAQLLDRVGRWVVGSASTNREESPVRIGLVLSGGGLRGAGHLGVLQRLIAHKIPIHVIVGSSVGAVVAAYYAAVGLTLEDMIGDALDFRGRHLMMHALNIRLHRRFDQKLGRRSGVIPGRLRQLEEATFERLHHGVRGIGVVCHDLKTGRPRYFSTGSHGGVRLSDVVRASASVPYLLPPIPVTCGAERLLLVDGGVSDSLPVAFAQRPPLSATHLIVSDCRWLPSNPQPAAQSLVYVRPRLSTTGTLWAPSSTLVSAVRQGAAAVTDDVAEQIQTWIGDSAAGTPASALVRSA
jgi:NTE family protein